MTPNTPILVTEDSFEEQVTRSPLPVLVDFHATWCEPCQRVAPIMEVLAERYAGKVRFARLDVDESHGLVRLMGIRSVPAVALLHDGQLKDLLVGERPVEDYERILDELLWEDAAPGRQVRTDLMNALVN